MFFIICFSLLASSQKAVVKASFREFFFFWIGFVLIG